LIGGSPCQSFSKAISDNTGFDGKSKLFFEYVRLLKELNPKYFLLENVVMKQEWQDVISHHLGVQPVLINSSVFSAQDRARLYWTNIPIPTLPQPSQSVLNDILESEVDERYFYEDTWTYKAGNGPVYATLNINGHDIIKRVNSRTHKCQTLTAVCGGNQQKKVVEGSRVRKLTPVEYERLQTVPDNYTDNVSNGARYKALGNGWTVDVVSHIFKGLA
jgi:DNA (cytosine-5)-methyltransferase 3A